MYVHLFLAQKFSKKSPKIIGNKCSQYVCLPKAENLTAMKKCKFHQFQVVLAGAENLTAKINKTENAFSPTLPVMLFNRKRNSKMLQKTNAVQNQC